MKSMRYLTLTAGLCLSLGAGAATLVENKDASGQVQRVLLEGNFARMDAGPPGNYMLVDLAKPAMFAVDHNQKMVVDLFAKPPQPPHMPAQQQPPEAPTVESKLVKIGPGPEIAGFATTQYQITANGEICGNEYLSAEVLDVPGLRNFVQTMQNIAESRKKEMGPMPFMQQMPPCARATEELEAELSKQGFSMRSADKDGKMLQEIVRITPDVPAQPGAFDLPADYQRTTPHEMMQKAMEQMQKMEPDQMKKMQEEMRKRMEEAEAEAAKQQPKP